MKKFRYRARIKLPNEPIANVKGTVEAADSQVAIEKAYEAVNRQHPTAEVRGMQIESR